MNSKVNPVSNDRLQAFQDRIQRLPYSKVAQRLTEAEFDEIVDFIEDHHDLNHLDFEHEVNRMHLDRPKSKNWAIVQELLVVANTAARGTRR